MTVFNVYRAPNGYLLSPDARVHEPHDSCTWLGVVTSDSFSEPLQRQIHDDLEIGEFAVLTAEQFYDRHPNIP